MPRRPSGRRGPGTSDNTTPKPPQSNRYRGATTGKVVKVRAGSTVLDAVIPAVYGDNSEYSMGLMAARRKYGNWYHFAWVFAFGEQASVDEVYIGNRKVWPVVTANGYNPLVVEAGVWVGDGSDPSANLTTGLQLWMSAAERQALGDFAGFSCRIDKNKESSDLSGQLVCKARLGGQIVTLSGGGTGVSDNPGDVAIDVATAAHWKGIAAARVDTGAGSTWDDFTSYCEEQMADGSQRYHFQGSILDRNPESVMADVVSHGLGNLYYNEQGKLCVWHEGPPAASSGTWTASASATITGSSGAALTEVDVTDWVIIGTSKGKVTAVNSDNEIVLDRAITESSASLRVLGKYEIEKHDWIAPPTVSDTPLGQIPDDVIVRYEDNDGNSQQHPKAADVTGDKRVEVRLSGCRTRKMAKRVSNTIQKVAEYQPYEWNGEVRPVVAGIQPGQILPVSTDILSQQLMKVRAVRWNVTQGTYSLTLREFDPSAFDEGTATEDTPPTVDVGDPDPPTAFTLTFTENGDWDTYSIVSDADDIDGWTTDAGLTLAYDAGDDETDVTLTQSTSGWVYGYLDITSDVDGFNVLFLTQLLRWQSGIDENTRVRVEYWSGANHAGATRKWGKTVTPYDNNDNDLYQRCLQQGLLTNDAYHEIRLAVRNTDPTSMTADSVMAIKRVRAIRWGIYGEPLAEVYDTDKDHVTAKLGLSIRADWTEDPSASTTISTYQMRGVGASDVLLGEVEQGEDTLTWRQAQTLQKVSRQWLGAGGTSELYRGPYMVCVGPTSKIEEFPVPTVAIESTTAPPTEYWERTEYAAVFDPAFPDTAGTFTIFAYYDTLATIPEGARDDYIAELWLDLAGGSSYSKYAEAVLDSSTGAGILGYGYNPMLYHIEGVKFVQTTLAQSSSATYQLWLRNKYNGKRTQMSEGAWQSGSVTSYAPPAPTVSLLTDTTHTVTNEFGDDIPYRKVKVVWSMAGATNEAVRHFEFETRQSPSGTPTRHKWQLMGPDHLLASWSDDQDATFSEDFTWPGSDDQMRVIAVGVYGHETESAWFTVSGVSTSESNYGDVTLKTPTRLDRDENNYFRNFVGVWDARMPATTGAVALYPFGQNAPPTAEHYGFRFHIKAAKYNSGSGVVSIADLLLNCDVNAGGAWNTYMNTGILRGEISDWDLSDVSLYTDASGYLCVLIGGLTDTKGNVAFSCDLQVYLGGADSWLYGNVDSDIGVTSLTSWTEDTVMRIDEVVTTEPGFIDDLTNVALGDSDTLLINDNSDSDSAKHVTADGVSDYVHAKAGDIAAQTAIGTLATGDLVLVEDVSSSNAKRKATVQDIVDLASGGSITAAAADFYKGTSTTQSISTSSGTDILWNSEREKDTGFTHSAAAAAVQVDFTGRVRISIDMTFYQAGSTAYSIDFWLMRDSGSGYAEVPGTRANVRTQTSGASENTGSINIILDVANGDDLKVQAQASGGTNYTVDNACRFRLEKLTEDAATTPVAGVPQTIGTTWVDSGASTSALSWKTILDLTSFTGDLGCLYFLYNDGATYSWRHRITVDGTVVLSSSITTTAGSVAIGPTAVTESIVPFYFSSSLKIELYNLDVSTRTLSYRYGYQRFNFA